ncbi:MAG: hypothetical protein RQ824_01085 [bacterium]|nr:hypothetical protein [bacterium]
MIDLKDKSNKFIIMGVVILIGVITIYYAAVDPNFNFRPFNSEAWKAGDAHTRGEMVDDLLKSGILKLKSREEVFSLLGEGEPLGDAITYPIELGVRVAYKAAQFRLTLKFDRKGRLNSYDIVAPEDSVPTAAPDAGPGAAPAPTGEGSRESLHSFF